MEKLIPFIVAAIAWVVAYKYFTSKNKGKLISHSAGFALSVLGLLVTIIVITPNEKEFTDYKVLNVSDYNYTLRDKQAVSITVGENKDNYIDITIHRENIKEGFQIDSRTMKSANGLISISGHWNKKSYFNTNKINDSFVKLQITSLNEATKEAIISIQSVLYSNDNDNKQKTINTTFTIKGQDFYNLIKKI